MSGLGQIPETGRSAKILSLSDKLLDLLPESTFADPKIKDAAIQLAQSIKKNRRALRIKEIHAHARSLIQAPLRELVGIHATETAICGASSGILKQVFALKEELKHNLLPTADHSKAVCIQQTLDVLLEVAFALYEIGTERTKAKGIHSNIGAVARTASPGDGLAECELCQRPTAAYEARYTHSLTLGGYSLAVLQRGSGIVSTSISASLSKRFCRAHSGGGTNAMKRTAKNHFTKYLRERQRIIQLLDENSIFMPIPQYFALLICALRSDRSRLSSEVPRLRRCALQLRPVVNQIIASLVGPLPIDAKQLMEVDNDLSEIVIAEDGYVIRTDCYGKTAGFDVSSVSEEEHWRQLFPRVLSAVSRYFPESGDDIDAQISCTDPEEPGHDFPLAELILERPRRSLDGSFLVPHPGKTYGTMMHWRQIGRWWEARPDEPLAKSPGRILTISLLSPTWLHLATAAKPIATC